MRRRSLAATDEQTEINLSPMIDCIFILLIFFIVTTVFVEESGVQVQKPDTAAANQMDNENITLEITPDNRVRYNGQEIGVGGVTARLKQSLSGNPDVPVVIRASREANHGVFAEVHGQVKAAGVEKVSYNIKN